MMTPPREIERLREVAAASGSRWQNEAKPTSLTGLLDVEHWVGDVIPAVQACSDELLQEARGVLLEDLGDAWGEGFDDLLFLAFLHYNDDRLVFANGIEGLRVARISFAASPEQLKQGIELGALDAILTLADETPYLRPRNPSESVIETPVGNLQLFGLPTEANLREIGVTSVDELIDDRDAKEIMGRLRASYLIGFQSHILWGSAACTFTDRRILGIVFDDPAHFDATATRERRSIPRSKILEGSLAPFVGTCLVFSAHRDLFTEVERYTGLFQSRTPYAQLIGDEGVALAVQALRVVDSSMQLSRPPKNTVTRAADQFLQQSTSD